MQPKNGAPLSELGIFLIGFAAILAIIALALKIIDTWRKGTASVYFSYGRVAFNANRQENPLGFYFCQCFYLLALTLFVLALFYSKEAPLFWKLAKEFVLQGKLPD